MKNNVLGLSKSKWICIIEYIISVVGVTFIVKVPDEIFSRFVTNFVFPVILFLLSMLMGYLYFISKRHNGIRFWKWKRSAIPTEYIINLPFHIKTVRVAWNRKRHIFILCILAFAFFYCILHLVNPSFPPFISYIICTIPLWLYGNLQLALLSVVSNNGLIAQVLLLIPVLFIPFTIHYVFVFFTAFELLNFLFPSGSSPLVEP